MLTWRSQVIGLSYGIEERDLWSELVTGREVMVVVVASVVVERTWYCISCILAPQMRYQSPKRQCETVRR